MLRMLLKLPFRAATNAGEAAVQGGDVGDPALGGVDEPILDVLPRW
jgi:hypothetical protein